MIGRVLIVSIAAMGMNACALFGPNRKPPEASLPAHYAARPESESLPTAEGVTQHLDVGSHPVPAWWREFQCPALDGLVAEGLQHSPSLSSARSALKAAREQLRQQIGQNAFPQVDAVFSAERQRALGIPVAPQYETFLDNVFAAQVQAKYTFDFFGASILADRSLAGQVLQQAQLLDATRRSLAANIVAATVKASVAEEQVQATQRLVALGNDRARQVAERYAFGSASKSENASAQLDAANTAATLPSLSAQAITARHALAALLGRLPDEAPPALRLDDLHLPENLPLSLPSDLLRQRPDILAADAAVRAAADAAGAATASMFPTLTLSASYGHGGFDWTTFTSPAGVIWGVGAQLMQPIFHGGSLQARRRQYQAIYEGAVADYQRTVLSAFQTVADTLVQLDSDALVLAETERALAAAGTLESDTQNRYQLGNSAYFATLTASQQVENTRLQYLKARAARLIDTVTLLDAMGDPSPPSVKSL